jgi:hypothetical protein
MAFGLMGVKPWHKIPFPQSLRGSRQPHPVKAPILLSRCSPNASGSISSVAGTKTPLINSKQRSLR